jgi:hypothetical protein
VYVPLASVLTSDPYRELSDGLQTAYVIGRVDMYKKEFVQLAFTQDNADWQVWIENSKEPLLRRADIVYKKQPGSPRVTLEFYDWDLHAQPDSNRFTFVKPEGAHEIQFLPAQGEK